ncbi:MAG: DUF362 domain-containing protein, partial [Thermodesulfobacteriota bacterium]
AVSSSLGLSRLRSGDRVFIKPNIVFWTRYAPFPKWGIITTSRILEDMIILLKENGITDIMLGEGPVVHPQDKETPNHAFTALGYETFRKRYGIRYFSIFDRPFKSVDLGEGVILNMNRDALESDFIVNLPVLKTHAQTMVSLGIKNLKGLIDIASRKKCHSPDPDRDLHFMISHLAESMPPMLTLIDGIYSNERGPGPDGKIHRSNLLVASSDVLSADLVGAKILGYPPGSVPYLAHAAMRHNRPSDLSDIQIFGEPLDSVSMPHAYDFPFGSDENGNILPVPLLKLGIRGISFRKYDSTLCTYCAAISGLVLTAIRNAWEGNPFDEVEILTGKCMEPTPGKKKTILLGKCMSRKHRNHPGISERFAVPGCPPDPRDIVDAFQKAGVLVAPELFEFPDRFPAFFMERYKNRPEFDESFFTAG